MEHRAVYPETRCFHWSNIATLLTCALYFGSIASNLAHAQVAPITPSGLNTQVSNPIAVGGQTQYDITGGTRPGGGANLFHSFGEFGVPTNNIANFLNETGVPNSNILGRVTGGNASSIFGTIQTTGFGNANLFLVNPAGFLFGPNATVNVGGMVAFTSADYLKLADNSRFNVIPNAAADALLTALPVASFGFLGLNPGAITVRGSQITVTEGSGISLVGGNITVQSARLAAPGGQINLASIASAGEVSAGDFMPASGMTRGSITLAQGATLDVSANAAGTVRIRGGELVMAESTISSDTVNGDGAAGVDINVTGNLSIDGPGSGIFTRTFGEGAGGDIFVNANSVTLQNGGTLSAETSGTASTATGGAITIDAETLSMDGATITAGTLADNTGRAGDVTISAKTIDTANFSFISTFSSGIGQAGDISLKATDRITLIDSFVNSDAASFSTTTAGNGGLIHLRAPMIDLQSSLLGTITLGAGNAGNLLLEAQQLNIQASEFGRAIKTGTELAAQTQGSGNAGTITIRGLEGEGSSADVVTITDASPLRSRTSGTGNAGNISIAAAQLTLTEGANLNSSTQSSTGAGGSINLFTETFVMQNGSTLSAETTGAGDAGTVTIQGLASPAQSVLIDGSGSGILTDTQGTGAGGNIALNATSVTLTNGAAVSASSTGQIDNPGDAGNIDITATNGFTMQNSDIKTQAEQGASGGDIKVTTSPAATVWLQNSKISASVADGDGGGGNISIDPQYVILQNSQILAQAADGQGGAITITANLFLPDANSIVNADSGSGLHGTVTIQSPNAPASGKIQPLGKTPLLATSLLNQPCASLAGGEFSSFTVAGRDSLPTEPGSWLASPLYAAGVGEGQGVRGKGQEGMTLGASLSNESALLSLRQIAPAGFLTQAFAVNLSASCQS